ncbi:MAG: dihydrofolate reductase family protein [Intrasporangium sp.]|uniref:dihydrofolate reductase family protein n=1 Tax=Intrasporangium sp. TaxID=1925024 RepID=UPI003F808C4F
MLTLRQIHPAPGADVPAVDAYARPDGRARHVSVNMVSSIDGAATLEGRVGTLTGPADQELLHLLRSLCDVLLVGAATIRAEGYGPIRTVRELEDRRRELGQAPSPRLAVVTRTLDLDLGSAAFTAAIERPILLTTELAGPDRVAAARAVADVLVVGERSVDLGAALDLLTSQGLPRILSEGGPRVLSELFRTELVDELCLAISPVVVAGAEPRITSGPSLPAPRPMELGAVYERDGFLFTRWLRSPRE